MRAFACVRVLIFPREMNVTRCCSFILHSVEEGDKSLKGHTLFQDFSDLAA